MACGRPSTQRRDVSATRRHDFSLIRASRNQPRPTLITTWARHEAETGGTRSSGSVVTSRNVVKDEMTRRGYWSPGMWRGCGVPIFMYLFTLENADCRFLRNVGIHEPRDTTSHPYRFVVLESRNYSFLSVGPKTPVFYVADCFRLRGVVALCWSYSSVWKYVKVTISKMSARLEGKVDLLDFLFQFRFSEWEDLYLHWLPCSFTRWSFIIAAFQQVIWGNKDGCLLEYDAVYTGLTWRANALPIFFLLKNSFFGGGGYWVEEGHIKYRNIF